MRGRRFWTHGDTKEKAKRGGILCLSWGFPGKKTTGNLLRGRRHPHAFFNSGVREGKENWRQRGGRSCVGCEMHPFGASEGGGKKRRKLTKTLTTH